MNIPVEIGLRVRLILSNVPDRLGLFVANPQNREHRVVLSPTELGQNDFKGT